MPTPRDLAQRLNIESDEVPLTTPLSEEFLRPLSDMLVSFVDCKRAERGLRPLTIAELRRLGVRVGDIVAPAALQAEPEI